MESALVDGSSESRYFLQLCPAFQIFTLRPTFPKGRPNHNTAMKIAIVGSGSIGLYYGAKLAVSGQNVQFLMRSGLDEARREGIRVLSPGGDLHLPKPSVHAHTPGIGVCDLVLIALKTTQNAAAATLLPPLVGPGTVILTLQNGLGNEEFLAGHFGEERILGGLCFVCLTRESPACVRHFDHGALSIGEFRRAPLPRTHAIVEAFANSGLQARVVEDLIQERWRKLVWNIPFNGLSVAEGGLTVDRILADPHLEARCRALMLETLAIAKSRGHSLPPEIADRQIDRTRTMGPYQPSTMVDYLAGRELEIESIWGEPLRQAKSAGLAVPNLEHLHQRLLAIQPST